MGDYYDVPHYMTLDTRHQKGGFMIGVYLGAYTAYHPGYNIIYQDINGKRDLPGDMMDICLDPYDYIIATPPCNYYSRAAGNRHSDYAINTAHLLPDILNKLAAQEKPFIVENVRNYPAFNSLNLFDYPHIYHYFIGRHTIWTNTPFYTWLNYDIEFNRINGKYAIDLIDRKQRQGSKNVHIIIERWLKDLHESKKI